MPNEVIRQLRSERGATITIALLVFLVCFTVSSIILAASTAAAGRMAEQAKMDQRYYSVTSAAELFEEQLGDGYAVATQTRYVYVPLSDIEEAELDILTGGEDADTADIDINKLNGVDPYDTDAQDLPKIEVKGAGGTMVPAQGLISYLTSELVFGDVKCPTKSSKVLWDNQKALESPSPGSVSPGGGTVPKLVFTAQDFDDEAMDDNLRVEVETPIDRSGTATLTFRNANGDKDVYELGMVLESDFETYSEQTDPREMSVTTTNGAGETAEVNVLFYKEKLTTRVSWHVAQTKTK